MLVELENGYFEVRLKSLLSPLVSFSRPVWQVDSIGEDEAGFVDERLAAVAEEGRQMALEQPAEKVGKAVSTGRVALWALEENCMKREAAALEPK